MYVFMFVCNTHTQIHTHAHTHTHTHTHTQCLYTEPQAKRDIWKQKVSNQRDEYNSLQRQWSKDYTRFGGKDSCEVERAALLGDRYGGAGGGGGGGGGGMGGGGAQGLDPESQMAMQRSHKAIDELEERGLAMLGSLSSQRERLKGASISQSPQYSEFTE